MSEIKVQCIDQAISFLNTPVISSGNVNYDRIVFDFCSRWDGYVKTAIFYRNKDEVYYQLLENDSCLIPNEVLGEKGVVYIGVFGTQGDKTITSQVLTYRIQEGAVTDDLKPSDPTPDIYAQLVGRFADFANELTDQQAKLDKFEERFNGSAGDAEKLGGQLPSYYATAQSVMNLENGTTPAGNALKLGGENADAWQNQIDLRAKSVHSTGITALLDYALTLSGQTGMYHVSLAGGSYTGTDLPAGATTYTDAMIYVRNTNINVELFDGAYKHKNYCSGGVWKGWRTYVSTADLTTALAGYLPKTGGTVNGNVTVDQSGNTDAYIRAKNALANILLFTQNNGTHGLYDSGLSQWIVEVSADGSTKKFNGTATGNLPLTGGDLTGVLGFSANGRRVIHQIDSSGKYFIWDTTNGKSILSSALDGTTTFNGTATGNLPLSNTSVPKVKTANNSVMGFDSTNDGGFTWFDLYKLGAYIGSYGFSKEGKPYAMVGNATKELLHTGNSAKVVVSSTPLTASGSIRVW